MHAMPVLSSGWWARLVDAYWDAFCDFWGMFAPDDDHANDAHLVDTEMRGGFAGGEGGE